jgi:TM2 domain-containing membrane protein YozV|tara:strand:- start:713 stop:910 length:198 start_codon:yes stop_codon:yes gene_type:complete
MGFLKRGIVGIHQFPSVVPGHNIGKVITIIIGVPIALLTLIQIDITNTEFPVTSIKRMVGVSKQK